MKKLVLVFLLASSVVAVQAQVRPLALSFNPQYCAVIQTQAHMFDDSDMQLVIRGENCSKVQTLVYVSDMDQDGAVDWISVTDLSQHDASTVVMTKGPVLYKRLMQLKMTSPNSDPMPELVDYQIVFGDISQALRRQSQVVLRNVVMTPQLMALFQSVEEVRLSLQKNDDQPVSAAPLQAFLFQIEVKFEEKAEDKPVKPLASPNYKTATTSLKLNP